MRAALAATLLLAAAPAAGQIYTQPEKRAGGIAPPPVVRLAPLGPATVIDGDTLRSTPRIRIWGIDAPERGEPGGSAATKRLMGLVAYAGALDCTVKDVDRYRRLVARCIASKRDIGEEMVRAGYARAYRRFTRFYVDAEAEARRERRGLWACDKQAPANWTAAKRLRCE